MKTHFGFVNDHSGSMQHLARAAMNDYNALITSVKNAATAEKQDAVVSVIGIGLGDRGNDAVRQVVVSNPHVLNPVTKWPTPGNTPLYDGIGDMINLLNSVPDANMEGIAYLVLITTDGGENGSRNYSRHTITQLINKCQGTGKWTFVFRVPKGMKSHVSGLGVPADNIQEWDTTIEGMQESTLSNEKAVAQFMTTRSAGKSSSSSFYADASAVNTTLLDEVPAGKTSLYVVDPSQEGMMLRDFILTKRMEYLKGSAFYQLTKTEAIVGIHKKFIVRDRTSGRLFHGAPVRVMLGLPTDRNARLHPGDHKNYDIFIQSESINRKLVGGTGVIYWADIGTRFTQAELDVFAPKPVAPATPAVIVLPKVEPTNKPTKSPIPVTPRFTYFATRDEGRAAVRGTNKTLVDGGKSSPKGKRWYF